MRFSISSASLMWLSLASYCFGADISAKIVPGLNQENRVEISLKGLIISTDYETFEKAVKQALREKFTKEKEGLDLKDEVDYTYNSESFEGTLNLDSVGGDLDAALKIIDYMKEGSVGTFVGHNSKCLSACALIFMAGRLAIPYMTPQSDRILEIGGDLQFEPPYPRRTNKTFKVGALAITRLLQALGDALPTDLYNEIMSKRATPWLPVDMVGEAVRWKIQLHSYTRPWPSAQVLLNTCLNFLELESQVDIGPVSSARTEYDERYAWPQLAQIYGDLNEERHYLHAPFLLKFSWLKKGQAAAQFGFDAGDTPFAYHCTAWTSNDGLHVLSKFPSLKELQRITDLDPFEQAKGYWYGYDPKTPLKEIFGDEQ